MNVNWKISKRLLLQLIMLCCSIYASAYDFESNGIYYDIGDNNTVSVTRGDTKYEWDIIIPNAVTHNSVSYSVTSIGSDAFCDCSRLTSIAIPSCVTSIGNYAFGNCSRLTSITIPNSVTNIGNFVFFSCSGLTSITIGNSVTDIGASAFAGCSRLTSITIPNNVTSIGNAVFQGCSSLTSIIVSNGNAKYDSRDNCNAIIAISTNTLIAGCKNTVIPNSVTCLGDFAFYSCSSLTSITIPNSVTSIGDWAFMGCIGLTSITIPNSVTSLGENAFNNCTNLKDVKSGIINPYSINDNVFESISSQAVLHVPRGTKDKYKSYSGWTRNFLKITEDITYTLLIKAIGNGYTFFDGTKVRNTTNTFTVAEGSSATVLFVPNDGNMIKSVTVNGSDVTSSVSDNQYTISNLAGNTTLEVEFKEISDIYYTLSIKASGKGAALYAGTVIRDKTGTFAVNEGKSATIVFSPDNGCRIKSVKLNDSDVTASVSDDQYTINKISENTTLDVEFESISTTTYTLSITATGNGSVFYDDLTIRDKTRTFTLNEGTSVTVTFSPDNDSRIKSVKVNDADVTANVVGNAYTISNISTNTTLEVEFGEIEHASEFTANGVNYKVVSQPNKTVHVNSGNYGHVLTIPASFTVGGITWKVVGVAEDALIDNKELAAIIWKPELKFDGRVSNPNLLLYVKEAQYASPDIQNIIVGDVDNGESLLANNIILVEAENGNDFYCPLAFIAKRISYEHSYSMISGYRTCQGWESLVLPFDVSMMISDKGTELVPYTLWEYGSNLRPYWIYELTTQGWQAANGIKANVPYIISMPNNEAYDSSYNITGNIEFVGNNVQIMASENVTTGQHGNKRLVANYRNQDANNGIYALNVNNQWNNNTDSSVEGSAFIRGLRQVRPFEAYLTLEGSNAGIRSIPVFDNETTGVAAIPVSGYGNTDTIYNLNGQRVNSMSRGIYIQNGRKIVKK